MPFLKYVCILAGFGLVAAMAETARSTGDSGWTQSIGVFCFAAILVVNIFNLLIRVGLGYTSVVGLSLEISHWFLERRLPDLSPYYSGYRHTWARVFNLSEYFLIMAGTVMVLSALLSINQKKKLAKPLEFVLFAVFLAAIVGNAWRDYNPRTTGTEPPSFSTNS